MATKLLFTTLHFLHLLVIVCAMTSSVNKHILVTGGNKGIGKALCAKLLQQYEDVHVLLGSRDSDRGERAVKDLISAIPSSKGRVEMLHLDVTSDDSVKKAAEDVAASGRKLFGIVNNAGIIGSYSDTLNVNYFGARRVNDAFKSILISTGGRVVNIASASGPMYVNGCSNSHLRRRLANPLLFEGGIEEIDEEARSGSSDGNPYGLSKALLNAYTLLLAKDNENMYINSCTPGFIDTDMTRNAGMGATNKPEKGTLAPLYCLMENENLTTGCYYGSDGVRSPLDRYRGPGDPPYEGP